MSRGRDSNAYTITTNKSYKTEIKQIKVKALLRLNYPTDKQRIPIEGLMDNRCAAIQKGNPAARVATEEKIQATQLR